MGNHKNSFKLNTYFFRSIIYARMASMTISLSSTLLVHCNSPVSNCYLALQGKQSLTLP